jgi:hypothetical protein
VIPDKNGLPLRTELVIERGADKTIKMHWWHKADAQDTPPHNHPWDFHSEIIAGGYTEQVWWVENGVIHDEQRSYAVGDTNHNTVDTYHLVVDVIPGTVTRMITGKATEGNAWGWLDLHSGKQIPAELDPNFMDKLKHLNPWM